MLGAASRNMECIINGILIKYENNELYSFRTHGWSKNKKWYILKGSVKGKRGYRSCGINGKNYSHHRLIYKLHNPEWDITDTSSLNQIDHIDRNKLNNNIDNLRVVTATENQYNTEHKGYYWNKRDTIWMSAITVDGKKIHLGCFVIEEEARNAYLEAKEKYHNV